MTKSPTVLNQGEGAGLAVGPLRAFRCSGNTVVPTITELQEDVVDHEHA
jgi:hypothetical protein